MLSSSLRTPLVFLVTYTVAVSAVPAVSSSPSLTVETSTSNVDADGLKDLKATSTIVNTGGETLKLLNDPRGVLGFFPEDASTITDPSGSHPWFDGATANYSPMDAAGLGDPSSFTVLAPGDSIDVPHGLFAAYNLTQSGAGEYSTEPPKPSTHANGDGTPKDLHATVEGIAKLSGDPRIAQAISRYTHDKRAASKPHGCSAGRQQALFHAADMAETLATGAYQYLWVISDATPRYTKWFGRYDPSRKAAIQSVFQRVSQGNQFVGAYYSCVCDEVSRGKYRAYIDDRYPGRIWICDSFWELKTEFQAAVLIHEFTHFSANGGTKDHGFGKDICKKFADYDPQRASENANNYMLFAYNPDRLR